MPRAQYVSIARVSAAPATLRVVDQTSKGYQDLVQHIKRNGVICPLIVTREFDPVFSTSYFEVVDGHQRLAAAIDADIKELPIVEVELSDVGKLQLQITLNVLCKAPRNIEVGLCLKRILTLEPDLTLPDMARRLEVPPAYIKSCLGLRDTCETATPLINDGKITLTNAYALARLPVDEQPDWLESAMTQTHTTFVPRALLRGQDIAATHKRQTVAAQN